MRLADIQTLRSDLGDEVGVWVAEYTRDPYVVLTLLSEVRPARLGTAIAQAFPRSPLVTAHAALDIDELSGNRFTLGLGSQVKRANEKWHGLHVEQPVEQVADYVMAVRAAFVALRGGEPRYDGSHYHFDLSGRQRSPQPIRIPPIYLAAVQPKMAQAAGQVADGVVGHMLNTIEYFESELVPEIKNGAIASNRDPRAVDLLLYRCCSPTDGNPDAEREAKRQIGFYAATKTYFNALATMGFASEAKRAQQALASRDFRALEASVSDAMLTAFALVGSIAGCARRLRESGSTANRLLLFPPYLEIKPERLLESHRAVIEVAKLHNAAVASV
jgi:probable F420-dependent oxidoreductase